MNTRMKNGRKSKHCNQSENSPCVRIAHPPPYIETKGFHYWEPFLLDKKRKEGVVYEKNINDFNTSTNSIVYDFSIIKLC